jgi:hypothetical protein
MEETVAVFEAKLASEVTTRVLHDNVNSNS